MKKRAGIFAAVTAIVVSMTAALGGCAKNGEEQTADDETYVSPLIVSDDDEPSLLTENEYLGASDDADNSVITEGDDSSLSDAEETNYADMYEDEQDDEDDADINDIDVATENTSELYDQSALKGSGEAGYNVSSESYSATKNITINYPRITNWNSDDKSEWNKLFKNEAKLEQKGLGYKDSATMDFDITEMNDTYLSLVTKVDEVINGAPHPYAYCYTYTIDMTTGDRVFLRDLVDVSRLAEVLLSEDGYEIENDDITMKDILDYQYYNGRYTVGTLADDLEYVDMDPKKVQKYGGSLFAQSYIDDGRIVLVFDVSHAMGDYATVIIN